MCLVFDLLNYSTLSAPAGLRVFFYKALLNVGAFSISCIIEFG